MTFVPEKPSLELALQHYGVKGMKWGVRRTDRSGGDPSLNRRGFQKKSSDTDIQAARLRNKARESRASELESKASLAALSGNDRQRAAAERALKIVEQDMRTNRDTAIASRSTRGEKMIQAIFSGPAVGMTLGVDKGLDVVNETYVNRQRRKAGLKD